MADLNARQGQNATRNWSVAQRNETALMLEDMYRGIAGDLKAVKKDILTEMKYSSLQNGVMYQSFEQGNKDTYAELKKQLSEICDRMTAKLEETAKKLQSAAANYQAKSVVVPAEETAQAETAGENASECADRAVMEIKYLYSQNQSIYESLSSALNELKESAGAFNEEFAAKIEETLDALDEKIENLLANETDYDKVAETVKERVAETLNFEEPDYDKIAELVAEKTEAQTAAHSKEILDTIAAVPTAENVDYNRIVDEVSDKVLEKVTELLEEKSNEEKETKGSAEYDRIVYGTAEKVIESLPPVERVDYTRIAEANALTDETLEKIAEAVAAKIQIPEAEKLDYDKLAETLAAKLPVPEEIDYDKLADTVLAKLPAPEEIDYEKLADAVVAKMPVPEAIDYDKLADTVIARLPETESLDYERIAEIANNANETVDYDRISEIVNTANDPVDYEKITEIANNAAANVVVPESEEPDYDAMADAVLAKLPESEEIDYERLAYAAASKVEIPETEAIDYEKIANDVAAKIDIPAPEQLDYERLASSVAERIPAPEPATYEVLVDDEGVKSIADTVAAAVVANIPEAKAPEVDTEALAGEISEKMGTPSYETILDESGAQMIADAVAEKLTAANYTIATLPLIAEETPVVADEVAVTEPEPVEEVAEEPKEDLVMRIDRSFTAKLKQSDDEVKDRYGMIKNALLSYKKFKSTVSWNADRFNCGRATIAKMNIRGKTLCVYFALDPKDPAFKQTIYNQKDMSEQKAYAQTPFMMKIKSDLAAKRAVRLVETLAEQNGVAKKKDFEEVDYKKTYRYAGDRQLELTGLLRKSMGKRAVFDFD
ncbi:MAG: hypothetical protein KID07_01910 [Firmicutes bacterium]|nr:hypothetical protein [Bacillota bacterium]